MALTTNTNSLQVDNNSNFALSPPTSVVAYVLAANVAVDITLATDFVDAVGKKPARAIFSATKEFYVKWNGAGATVPSANITNGSSEELNPGVRNLTPINTLSIVSPVACVVTISLFTN